MAILKAQSFDLEFCYYDLNSCNEIEYSLSILLNEKPLFNPSILNKKANVNIKEKFRITDCYDCDWLQFFFYDILKTKKGRSYVTDEIPSWKFQAITWEDKKEEKQKSQLDKLVKIKNENGEIIDLPYADAVDMFTPLFEENIEFIITFPEEIFDTQEYTTVKLSFQTTFFDLIEFMDEFQKEMNHFYNRHQDRIEYLGKGEYRSKEDLE